MADIAIRCDLVALSRDQKKLFSHFGEAGTAVFAVEEVEYGGHDRTPSFDIATLSSSRGARRDLAHSSPAANLPEVRDRCECWIAYSQSSPPPRRAASRRGDGA